MTTFSSFVISGFKYVSTTSDAAGEPSFSSSSDSLDESLAILMNFRDNSPSNRCAVLAVISYMKISSS